MRVDFLNHPRDLRVAVLASLGFSTEYISNATGFTSSQVVYRLRLAGVKRIDYRSGESTVARIVLRTVERKASTSIGRRIGHKEGKKRLARKS